MNLVKGLYSVVMLMAVLGLPEQSQSEDPAKYPERPITLTGGWAAGGDTDLVCRAISTVAPKFAGQPLIVLAKPGGAGLVAVQNLVSSNADGYTLHLGRASELCIGPLVEKYPFEIDKEILPVGQMGIGPIVFSVNADTPWKTIEEFVAAAKAEPGKIKFAVASTIATTRMAFEKFCYEAGVKCTVVAFKGGAPAGIAVAGGHIPAFPAFPSEILPHYKNGKLRVLLAFTEKRVKEFPDVPTAKEKGYDVAFGSWYAVFARKGTPDAVLNKIEIMMKKTAEEKEFMMAMERLGCQNAYLPGSEFMKKWVEERKWMEALIKSINLKAQ
jgi:tripartite-type tricarboxylate transporter receptor subunit TctC